MEPARTAVGVVAVVVIAWVLYDAFELMLLPRRSHRRLRFARLYFRAAWAAWRAVGCRMRPGRRRESFLSIFGPMSLVGILVVWIAMLVAAFGSLQWALAPNDGSRVGFGRQLFVSGVTVLTIGYGDTVPHAAAGKLATLAEAAAGFGLLAVIIGYLPVLYQLFSRRESQIIRLDARAGSPPTATTLLVRHAEGQRMDAFNTLLSDWEQWAAELAESQLSYPMLAFYRSQQPDECWLASLTAILDSCALVLVGLRDVNTFQARVTFGTARLALIEMARVFTPAQADDTAPVPDGARLSVDDFPRMRRALEGAGLHFSLAAANAAEHDGDEAVLRELATFRAAYEPYAVALAGHLLLPMPRWVAPEGQLDNWQRIEEPAVAQRLLERVETQPR